MKPALLLLFIAACQKPVAKPPRLAVLVIFDQMRAADLDRDGALFAGGFGGLEGSGGARYDARYTYANTETGPGHATISTGANPAVHGIVSNYWFDGSGAKVYCVEDSNAPVLGAPQKKGAGPKWLAARTLADTLRLESSGKAHVVTLSLKDRAAVLTGGASADVALWYDLDQCAFTSSQAYVKELPQWASTLSKELPARAMREGHWSPLPTPLALQALVPADASASESGELGWDDRFPHDLATLKTAREQCVQYRASPQAIDDLFALGKAAVLDKTLNLGGDEVPDLLVISVSSTDYVGHGFGPLSLESFDMRRRADAAMRGFVRFLDEHYGRDGYIIAVTSDHASTPQPELAQALRIDAARIDADGLKLRIEETVAALAQRMRHRQAPSAGAIALARDRAPLSHVPPAPAMATPHSNSHMLAKDQPRSGPVFHWLRGFAPPHIYLNLEVFTAAERPIVIAAVAELIRASFGIAAVYPVEAGRVVGDDAYVPHYQELIYEGRYGQLMIRPRARYIFAFAEETTGTDHGTPYNYDATVPFIIRGPGVRGGRYAQPCDVRDIAPSIAFSVHMPSPDHAQGRPVSALGAER